MVRVETNVRNSLIILRCTSSGHALEFGAGAYCYAASHPPVLTIRSSGAEGNKYGFEGGRVIQQDGRYHLFTSEMVGDPHWVQDEACVLVEP